MNFPKYHQTNSQERLGVNAVAEAIAKLARFGVKLQWLTLELMGRLSMLAPRDLPREG